MHRSRGNETAAIVSARVVTEIRYSEFTVGVECRPGRFVILSGAKDLADDRKILHCACAPFRTTIGRVAL